MTPPPARAPHWKALVGIAVATFVTAAIGAFASIDAKDFYAALNQPSWSPPPTVFGPVWSVLYVMMCAAAWLVVQQRGLPAAWPALRLYAVQLVLNALWTWLFFRWHLGALAFAEVLVLLAMVAATALAFRRARPLAGWLMLPYIAWVAFASALTLAMWRLNPGLL
jgi:benzodiazapine receptor